MDERNAVLTPACLTGDSLLEIFCVKALGVYRQGAQGTKAQQIAQCTWWENVLIVEKIEMNAYALIFFISHGAS